MYFLSDGIPYTVPKIWFIFPEMKLCGCSAQTQTRMGCLRKSPEVEFDSYRWLSHLGVRAPYEARRKRRYEANQVWMNTTFISQGPLSWGKLAVETWRVKTELIIITILHIIIITTSAPKMLAHIKCINKYWKYTQIFAATKPSKTYCKKSSNIGTCLKYSHMHKILALAQNVGGLSKYRRQMYAANVCVKCLRQMFASNVGVKCWRQMLADFRNIRGKCWRPIYAEL